MHPHQREIVSGSTRKEKKVHSSEFSQTLDDQAHHLGSAAELDYIPTFCLWLGFYYNGVTISFQNFAPGLAFDNNSLGVERKNFLKSKSFVFQVCEDVEVSGVAADDAQERQSTLQVDTGLDLQLR